MSEPSPGFVSAPIDSGIDRRVWTRYSSNLATSCRIKAALANGSASARVRNISGGGISLVVSHPADTGAVVPLELKSTLRSFTRTLELRVLYCVEHPGGDWILGGEFVQPLDEEELRHFLSWNEPRRESSDEG
jgi:hypothetical protein